MIAYLRGLVPAERAQRVEVGKVSPERVSTKPRTGASSARRYRIANNSYSPHSFGAMSGEERIGERERRENRHEMRETYLRAQGGIVIPPGLECSRVQCEEFGAVAYHGSSTAPSMPTLEKIADLGGLMAPLEGRAGDPLLHLCQGVQAMKTAWAGPGPRDGTTYAEDTPKCDVYLLADPEKAVEAFVMLDVRVADELLLSVCYKQSCL